MSKANLDSDLYGDIYGDEYNEYAVPVQDADLQEQEETQEEDQPEESKESSPEHDVQSSKSTPFTGQDAHRSLPAKPSAQSTQAAQLSYSAQIAKQFSVYQQTPSQERQQRTEIPLPRNPRDARPTNPIPTVTTSVDSGQSALDPNSVFGKKPSEMHDAGKMFIGGLNWDTTDEGLRDYFQQFGKVDACTIMREPNGTSRGFAFLTFEDPAAVNVVVTREHVLDGKAIDPKRAIPREEHLRNTRYFVGGLSANTTSDSMREFFGAYGKVVDATVMLDRESGRSKGFGFVTFEDASNTEQMVGKIGLTLDDKEIEVKLAQPRSQREQTRNLVGKITNTRETERETQQQQQQQFIQPTNTSFPSPNPMAMMFQRSMNQMPMMGASMPMMNMPMMGMGMGMNGFGGMGMNPMNMMAGMNGFAGGGMGNVNALRLGMGPIGGGMPGFGMMGGNAMANSAMGMRPGMNGLGLMNATAVNNGRASMNTGPGPNRTTNRGQHGFHPYAR